MKYRLSLLTGCPNTSVIFKILSFLSLGLLSAVPALCAPLIFNPHPMPDDLVLPLPCSTPNPNYQMVFRKIYTHSKKDADLLTSFEFIDGTNQYGNAAIQSPRKCQVRGNFHDENGRFFYLAKYELTVGQYDAIVKHKCSISPLKYEAMAKAEISIDEAREVAKLYSDFLQTVPSTPHEGSELASATLPFECYWSFAQRGGLAVTKEQLENDLPYLGAKHNLKDYAWAFGADSSNGKIQLIGRKIPNALGLFDLLGNVQEYIDEPFQATGIDGLIAQKGGSTIRGGSILTPYSQLTSSLRTEKKRYTNHQPTRSKDTGMRLMLNVSVTLDPSHLKQLEQAVLKEKPLQNSAVTIKGTAPTPKNLTAYKSATQPKKEPTHTDSRLDYEVKPPIERDSQTPGNSGPGSNQSIPQKITAQTQTGRAGSTDESQQISDAPQLETISDFEASQHINQYCTVCGTIAQITELANLTYLNFENRHPYQTFVVFLTNARDYGDIQKYVQRKVCATGIIKQFQNTPRITNPVKLELVK